MEKNKQTRLIIDIGLGMGGNACVGILDKYENVFVVAVDPSPICRDLTLGNFNARGFNPNSYVILPYAVHDCETGSSMKFYITANDPGCSSLYKPTKKLQDSGRPIENEIIVETITIANLLKTKWCKDFSIIDYIKIDAQGSDLAILRSGRQEIKDKVAVISVTSDGDWYENSDTNFENLLFEMSALGFEQSFDYDVGDHTFVNSRLRDYARSAIVYCA